MGGGDLPRDGLDLQRPHVVGRGVDHVAAQGEGVADPQGFGAHRRVIHY